MSRAIVTQSLSSLSLCIFAMFVLATSLISTNRATVGAHQRLSTMEWYWGKTILPDHPAYSVLMARDRLQLVITPASQQPQLRLQFAERRFQAAKALAELGKTDLAVSTLSKSQTYVVQAARGALADGLTLTERQELASSLDHSLYRMTLFHEEYPEIDTPMLHSLREETKMLLQEFVSGS